MTPDDTRAASVLADIARHPGRHLVSHWNWKASVTSAVLRGLIFFAFNWPAGVTLAVRAMFTELVFRTAASGVLGSLSEALRYSRPRIVPLILLPSLGHLGEFAIHHAMGTPRLSSSMAASIGFSVLSTAFTLFAMRRGALIVGPGRQPLATDLRRMPSLLVGFALSSVRVLRSRRRPFQPERIDPSKCS